MIGNEDLIRKLRVGKGATFANEMEIQFDSTGGDKLETSEKQLKS